MPSKCLRIVRATFTKCGRREREAQASHSRKATSARLGCRWSSAAASVSLSRYARKKAAAALYRSAGFADLDRFHEWRLVL